MGTTKHTGGTVVHGGTGSAVKAVTGSTSTVSVPNTREVKGAAAGKS